ncbi:MAG: nitronate monooxygenase [Pseudomonadota bacterium]
MIKTRFTERFDLQSPIVQAPMAGAAGGRLAGAVSQAGAMGFIGGGYGDADWLAQEFKKAGNRKVGCGFITWSLREQPLLLDQAIDAGAQSIFLSFDDPSDFAPKVKSAGLPLFCQIQTLSAAKAAIDAGADVIIAQGAEAGGHGASRGTFSLVAEVADAIRSSDTLLLAAGGIADGRGLAASLMLGADGVLMGTRFWAAEEALVPQGFWDRAVGATGDETGRSKTIDITRGRDWPDGYGIRGIRTPFSDEWDQKTDALRQDEQAKETWNTAFVSGDADIANPIVGEAVGLINSIQPAADIIEQVTAEAESLLRRASNCSFID